MGLVNINLRLAMRGNAGQTSTGFVCKAGHGTTHNYGIGISSSLHKIHPQTRVILVNGNRVVTMMLFCNHHLLVKNASLVSVHAGWNHAGSNNRPFLNIHIQLIYTQSWDLPSTRHREWDSCRDQLILIVMIRKAAL